MVSCTAANTGGPLMGAPDDHCTDMTGMIVQDTDPASCHPEAGPPDPDAGPPEPYGDPQNGAEGDDDDCKYHIKWSSTPVCVGSSVFTITVTRKSVASRPRARRRTPRSRSFPRTSDRTRNR